MPLSFYAIDEEFAASSGSNVNYTANTSIFDNPPNAFTNLIITANAGDPDPRLFEEGDTYDLSWGGFGGGGSIEDAVVIRSDVAPGGGGIIVLEGLDEHGDLTQIIWTPGFNLEAWYWDNHTPSDDPQFWTSDQNATYNHSFICFAAEALICTNRGWVMAGDITPGCRVQTLDNGLRTVRWVSRRVVPGRGAGAPVVFAAGTIGNVAELRLSPQHRVLVGSPRVELLFGVPEVLAPARAFVRGSAVRLVPCRSVIYVHLLLDRHEVILAQGAPCESLFLGQQALDTLDEVDRAALAEVQARVPANLAKRRQNAARPLLNMREAQLLLSTLKPRQNKNNCAVALI